MQTNQVYPASTALPTGVPNGTANQVPTLSPDSVTTPAYIVSTVAKPLVGVLMQTSQVYPASTVSTALPTGGATAPTDGTAYKVPTHSPDSVTTPSGKIYQRSNLFEDNEGKAQSAWFTVDPLRATMGNRQVQFWPKLFGCIVLSTCIMNFLVIIVPACGYFCAIMGGKKNAGEWDMYIPCNLTCGGPRIVDIGPAGCTNDVKCALCQGDCNSDDDCEGSLKCFQRGYNHFEDKWYNGESEKQGLSVPGCDPMGMKQTNTSDHWYCYDPQNIVTFERCTERKAQWSESNLIGDSSSSCIDGPGIPERKSVMFWSRVSRATPVGMVLLTFGYVMMAWTCCWGAAFLPAYHGFHDNKPDSPCGPLKGPQTSRLLFTILSVYNGIAMLVVLPYYFSDQIQRSSFFWFAYLNMGTAALFFFGATRFAVGSGIYKTANNSRASLTGFISTSLANVLQMITGVELGNLGRDTTGCVTNCNKRFNEGESTIGAAIAVFMPPMLLFFFMLIYLAFGRFYYKSILAYCATCNDKKGYDKLWSQAKKQLDNAPASSLKKSKSGANKIAHRPTNQMFYIDGPSPTGKQVTLKQPFDGNKHPHNRVVALFHFAKFANTVFQNYINEWSNAVPGTHSKNSPVKSPYRAVQKLQRSYGLEHALRLLDLVRATVVCPDLHMLANVVNVIYQDKRVKVLREKNAWADGVVSPTGYRNYQMIVQVLDVGCAGFLCEIQLDLQSFHDEKNRPFSSGHANYKKRRNLMGE